MKISTKLWMFIVLVILLISLVSVIGIARGNGILAEGRTNQISAIQMVQVATQWNGLTQTNAARNVAMMLSGEPAVVATFKDAVTETSAEISELQKKLETFPLTPVDKAQLQKIASLRKTMFEFRDLARQAKAAGKNEEARLLMNTQYLPSIATYVAAQKELVAMQQQQVLEILAQTEQRRVANTVGILAGLAVILTFIAFATHWLIRSIRQPLEQANDLAARIAQGDLSADVETTREDEFGQLLRSLRTMKDSLGRMVHQVRQSTDSIATASAEIAAGNNDLAQRTEQTSSNLQATASSMDKLTITVQQSADNAHQASGLAANASAVAEKGGVVVQQVVATMEEINDSSRKISDIIGVIDGIAFQTNILALNAAVEAARAGEQGRGFAVVASEVRSLAQRSAEAAKEIKSLIGKSVEKVESGTKLVSDAGATMTDIVQSVRKVADVIGEITATSSEQSSGIAQVNQAIGNLDQMTQQNAALVEESAAAAESLRDQAQQMAQAVSVFKVSNSLAVSTSRPVKPAKTKPAPALSKPRVNPGKKLAIASVPAKPRPAPAISQTSNDEWETF